MREKASSSVEKIMAGTTGDDDESSTSFGIYDYPEEEDGYEDMYLSLFHYSGHLGAAYYVANDGVLHLMNDLADPGPHHGLVATVLAQLSPRHVMISSKSSDAFSGIVKQLVGPEASSAANESTSTSATTLTGTTRDNCMRHSELLQLPSQDYNYANCERRLLSQRLPGSRDADDHHLLIHGLVDASCEAMVRAAGALLRYLDKNKVNGPDLDHGSGGPPILAIRQWTPEQVVRVDETTLAALQIFTSTWQPSGARAGSWNRKREGLSLFNVVNRCKSVLGSRQLRYMLRCLPRNLSKIDERQEAVKFFSHPSQTDLVKSLQECLRKMKNISRFLQKLTSNQASVRDWKCLNSTILHMIVLTNICHSSKQKRIKVLHDLACHSGSEELTTMAQFLDKVFDVELSEERNRFVVKSGIDESLDERRRLHNGLPDLLYRVAQEEVEDLPDNMDQCTMVYVPQIGYLLAVQPWRDDLEQVEPVPQYPGLQFMFYANHVPHFKSARCVELDSTLGDTATNICEQETAIMLRLAEYILSQSQILMDICHSASQLDCLVALAVTALDNGWTRPEMKDSSSPLVIQEGRHPLQEMCVSTFVPNTTVMGDKRMVILTGPNACGKSVYLKQLGLIVFLAHLGSWVPAESASVPLIDGIFSRIQTLDSIQLGLSAFMVDVNQMALALNTATDKSLVLVDEFGKGTAEVDGQALLASCLDFWLQKQEAGCPKVVVSTHFQSVKSLLRPSPMLTYQTFAFEQHGEELIYLYKLKDGLGLCSQAKFVARKAGIEDDIIQRSEQVLQCITQGLPLNMAENSLAVPLKELEPVCDDFLNIDLEEDKDNVDTLLDSVFERVKQITLNSC